MLRQSERDSPGRERRSSNLLPVCDAVAVLQATADDVANLRIGLTPVWVERRTGGARLSLTTPAADERPLAEKGRLPEEVIEAAPVLGGVNALEPHVGAEAGKCLGHRIPECREGWRHAGRLLL